MYNNRIFVGGRYRFPWYGDEIGCATKRDGSGVGKLAHTRHAVEVVLDIIGG